MSHPKLQSRAVARPGRDAALYAAEVTCLVEGKRQRADVMPAVFHESRIGEGLLHPKHDRVARHSTPERHRDIGGIARLPPKIVGLLNLGFYDTAPIQRGVGPPEVRAK